MLTVLVQRTLRRIDGFCREAYVTNGSTEVIANGLEVAKEQSSLFSEFDRSLCETRESQNASGQAHDFSHAVSFAEGRLVRKDKTKI